MNIQKPTHNTSSGKALLRELNITKVFDLRSDVEIQKYNAPLPSIDGVEVLHTPVFKLEDYSPEVMAKYVSAHFLKNKGQQGVYLPCDFLHTGDINFMPVGRQR